MLRSASRLIVLALTVSSAFAQSAPPPPQPFPAVVELYVGRMLDSTDNENDSVYADVSTRARAVVVAPEIDRLYVLLNFGTLAIYRLSTLEARIASESPGATTFGEEILAPEILFGSSVPFWAGIEDLDYDDRSYTYLVLGNSGLSIYDPAFNLVATAGSGLVDPHVAVIRSGATYYAVVSRDLEPSTSIYDVTNPAAPVLLRTIAGIKLSGDDSASGHFVYYAWLGSVLHVYVSTVERLLNDQPPLFVTPAPLMRPWITDGTNFFSEPRTSDTSILVLQPQGATYALSQLAFPATVIPVAASTRDYFGIGRYLYAYSGDGFQLVEGSYFRTYGMFGAQMLAPVTVGGRRLLIVPAWSLLEVFALGPAPQAAHVDVPTASEWMLLTLAAMLGAVAVLRLRLR